jgi:uncharacterized tellurite resistance protein B-like protein
MLADLLRRLKGEDSTPLPADDARIAIAALLVIAANVDHDYAEAERAQIERVLADRYSLGAEAAAKLRADGEAAEAAAMDMYKFTTLVKKHIEFEERTSVLDALWRVVLSDSLRNAEEETFMRRVTDLLGLDPRDSVDARRRVSG